MGKVLAFLARVIRWRMPASGAAAIVTIGTTAKSVFESRTFWVGVLFILAGLIGLAALAYVALPPGTMMACLTAIGAGASHIGLRFVSWRPVLLALPSTVAAKVSAALSDIAAEAAGAGEGIARSSLGGSVAGQFAQHIAIETEGADSPLSPSAIPAGTADPQAKAAPSSTETSPIMSILSSIPSASLLSMGFTLIEEAPSAATMVKQDIADFEAGKLTEKEVIDSLLEVSKIVVDLKPDSKLVPYVKQLETGLVAIEATLQPAAPAAAPAAT